MSTLTLRARAPAQRQPKFQSMLRGCRVELAEGRSIDAALRLFTRLCGRDGRKTDRNVPGLHFHESLGQRRRRKHNEALRRRARAARKAAV